jgi:hypothetical protein
MGGRGGSGRSSAAVIQVPAGDANAMADQDIRDAYQNALDAMGKGSSPSGQQGGPWVNMLRLRTALSQLGWDRAKQDQELMRFIRQRKAYVHGEANRKAMTPQHVAAQLLRGGDTIDVISLKDWRPR